MTKATTKETGCQGERLAADLLTAKGYAIVARNARVGDVEVDIIARHANRLVIVEVKTRGESALDPAYGMDRRKLARLCRAGAAYVKGNGLPHEVQIDAILVTRLADGSFTLEHLADISLPPMRRPRR